MLVVPRVTPDLAEIQHPRRVSVVITIYNQARYVRPCVESVIAQTHTDWEILLIDDGSNDGVTGQACAAALDIPEVQGKIKVKRIKNGGVSVARNVGIALSDPAAPYILFLDGDDLLLPNALSSLLATLEEAPEAVASVGCCQRVDDQGVIEHPDWHERDFGGQMLNFPFIETDPGLFPPATVLSRKWAARACGGFDGAMPTVEDFDFFLRLSLWGPLKGISDFVCHYRRHPQNVSQDDARMNVGWLLAWAKHADYYRAWKHLRIPHV